MPSRIYKYVFWVLLALFLAGAVIFYLHEKKNKERIDELTSVIAIQAETIEINKGVYQKQSVLISDLNNSIGRKDAAIENLLKAIESQHAKIASLNQLVV